MKVFRRFAPNFSPTAATLLAHDIPPRSWTLFCWAHVLETFFVCCIKNSMAQTSTFLNTVDVIHILFLVCPAGCDHLPCPLTQPYDTRTRSIENLHFYHSLILGDLMIRQNIVPCRWPAKLDPILNLVNRDNPLPLSRTDGSSAINGLMEVNVKTHFASFTSLDQRGVIIFGRRKNVPKGDVICCESCKPVTSFFCKYLQTKWSLSGLIILEGMYIDKGLFYDTTWQEDKYS